MADRAPGPHRNPLHEGLLQSSEAVKREGTEGDDADSHAHSWMAFAKQCAFRSLFAVAVPVPAGGSSWYLERLLIWIQVRVHRRLSTLLLLNCGRLCGMAVQLLSFPLSGSPHLLWRSTTLSNVSINLSYVRLAIPSPTAAESGVYAAMGWTAALCAAFVWIGYSGVRERFVAPWMRNVSIIPHLRPGRARAGLGSRGRPHRPIAASNGRFLPVAMSPTHRPPHPPRPRVPAPTQLFQHSTRFSCSYMFIPLISNLATPFQCEGTWLSTGWGCNQGQHLALSAICAILMFLFVSLALMGTSPSPSACELLRSCPLSLLLRSCCAPAECVWL